MISVDPTASVPGLFGPSAPPAAAPADAAGASSRAAFALLLQQLGASAPDAAEVPSPAPSVPGPAFAPLALPAAGARAQRSPTGVIAGRSAKPQAGQADVASMPASDADDSQTPPLLMVLTLAAPAPTASQSAETGASVMQADTTDSMPAADAGADRAAGGHGTIAAAAVPPRNTVSLSSVSESEAADPIGSPAARTAAPGDPLPTTTGANPQSPALWLPALNRQIQRSAALPPSRAAMNAVTGTAASTTPPQIRPASQRQADAIAHVTSSPVAEQGSVTPRPPAQPSAPATVPPTTLAVSAGTASGGRGNAGDEPADNRSAWASRQAAAAAAQTLHVPVDQPALPAPTLQTTADAISPALEAGAEPPLPAQIVQAIKLQANAGGGEARVRLQPDYLGEVTIAIKVEHGGVTAWIEAASPEVRDWVSGHEPMLKQALGDQGLRLDRLVVQEEAPRSDGEDAQRGSGRQQQEPPRPRRQPELDATFELLV